MLDRRMVAADAGGVGGQRGGVRRQVVSSCEPSSYVPKHHTNSLGVAHRVVAGSVVLVREGVDHVGAGRDRSIVVRVGIVDDHVDRGRSEVEDRPLSRRPIGETDEAAVVLELRVRDRGRRGCGAPRAR